MKFLELFKSKGYKNILYEICEFFKFEDTDQLKWIVLLDEEKIYLI